MLRQDLALMLGGPGRSPQLIPASLNKTLARFGLILAL